ncbi:MAG: hypothetical protein M1819_006770 [Sarea resinae]|nr:MAG: hypothetical protein M1819_006770 [Sarea resinae]
MASPAEDPIVDLDEKATSPQTRSDESAIETGVVELDRVAVKKLVRKLDLHIIPVVMGLYLLSFLDRVNIGNARLYGLEEDLNLTGNKFQVATSILFVPYILSELPSNLVLKKFKPSRWIAFIATSWGIIATLTGVVESYGGLIVCRLLLGLVEGGLFPGMATYLTLFYTRDELALRIGFLFVSAALAGAFGGLLSYGIGFMDGVGGQRAWRWILIIEGLPTFVLGILTFFVLADKPETAYYLTPEDKALMVARRERQTGHTASAQKFHWADVRDALTDWRVWAMCIAQFGVDTMLYGYSTFLPTIIKGLGHWDSPQTNALTVPCYALGAIAYIVVAIISDRQEIRGFYTVAFGLISVIGYAILISDVSSGAHYFACFLVALGLYVCVGLPLAWLPNNCPRYGKRTTATGLQLSLGNCSGIMAPFLYETYYGPRYTKGHAVTLSLVAFASCVYAVMAFYFSGKNKRREAGDEDGVMEGKTEEEINEMGDWSPRFRYER